MVDLQKPCVKCGVADRYKNGDCKACRKKRKRHYLDLTKPCVKCGVVDRYKNGDCKACSKKRQRHYLDLTKPCVNCGVADRYKSGKCKGCNRNRKQNYRKTNAYREKRKKQDDKAKKRNFEFSLQTQKQAIQQCQQKST